MSGKRIYELTEKSNLENDYFMALDKSGTANAQKVNVSKILNPINNISGSADEYSSTKAYAVGDLVIHDNKLYKCTTACSAAAWSTNQGYFTQSTLTTELTNVKSSLNNQLCQTGVMPSTLNETKKMTTTFKPKKFIMFMFNGSAGTQSIFKYDANIDNTLIRFITSTGNIDYRTIGTSNCIVKSVDNDGITLIPYAQALLDNPFLVFYF